MSVVNPNEAPEGYVAIAVLDGMSCSGCVNADMKQRDCVRDWKFHGVGCLSNNRRDRCNVVFAKREECPTQPETIRERSRADIMAALNMAHEERRLAEAYIAEHVAIAFKSFHEKTGLRIKGLSIETTEHRGIDGMSPYHLTSNTLVTGVRMEVGFL